jgi:hypothetical protein
VAPLKIAADGCPDITAGTDKARFHDEAYLETLSAVSERLGALRAKITSAVGEPAELVDFGHVPGSNELIVYWSGSLQAPVLARIEQLATADGIGLILAVRRVSKAQLSAATERLEADPGRYEGIVLSAFGGFSADFDGMHVWVDPDKSTVKDLRTIEATLEADLGIPVSATFGARRHLMSGKYDDSSPVTG